MRVIKMKHILLLFPFLVLFASCSKDDPITPNPPVTTYVKVKTGSSFTYEKYDTDSTGAKIAGTTQTIIETILKTDMTWNGKSGVFMVANNDPVEPDTMYYAYESNDDVSLEMNLTDLGLPPLWVKIPVASGNPEVSVVSATTEISPGIIAEVSDSITVSLVGSESMTIKGNAIAVRKMKMNMSVRAMAGGITLYGMTVVMYVYYAPSLGFYAKTEYPAIRDAASGGWSNGSIQTLMDYVLK